VRAKPVNVERFHPANANRTADLPLVISTFQRAVTIEFFGHWVTSRRLNIQRRHNRHDLFLLPLA
jgi:hypothetical protein